MMTFITMAKAKIMNITLKTIPQTSTSLMNPTMRNIFKEKTENIAFMMQLMTTIVTALMTQKPKKTHMPYEMVIKVIVRQTQKATQTTQKMRPTMKTQISLKTISPIPL